MPGNVPAVEGERANLLAYLDQQRAGIRLTAFGLTEEQARATPTASALSVGGLIKHVTATERSWMNDVLQRSARGRRRGQYGEDFKLGPDETLQEILRDSEQCGRETAAIIADIADLGQPVPVPKDVPWFPEGRRVVGGALGPTASDRRDCPARRSRRHHPRTHRRRADVPDHGGSRALAGVTMDAAMEAHGRSGHAFDRRIAGRRAHRRRSDQQATADTQRECQNDERAGRRTGRGQRRSTGRRSF